MSSAVLTSSSSATASVGNVRASQAEKPITLDFGEQRRHSFLPEGWSEQKRDSNTKHIAVVEDDDLFLYMHTSSLDSEKPTEKFCTGGKYLGQWNRLGMAGKGVYKYPHGVIYDGYFNRNGEFHGTGILVYPNGHRIEGIWKNGKLGADCNFIAKGGVVMNPNYCLMPDRRFQIEFESDFNPVGQEYLTDEVPPPRVIPNGCYDMVNGFYDPDIKSVCQYPKDAEELKSKAEAERKISKYLFSGDETRREALAKVLLETESEEELQATLKAVGYESRKIISWIPSVTQEEWIIKNCRKAWKEHIGYRPDLYEEWTKGGQDYSGLDDEEIEQDSKCRLKALKLDKEPSTSPSKRLISFMVNKSADQNIMPANLLTKIFEKHAQESTTELRMFTSRQGFISEELLLPSESRQ